MFIKQLLNLILIAFSINFSFGKPSTSFAIHPDTQKAINLFSQEYAEVFSFTDLEGRGDRNSGPLSEFFKNEVLIEESVDNWMINKKKSPNGLILNGGDTSGRGPYTMQLYTALSSEGLSENILNIVGNHEVNKIALATNVVKASLYDISFQKWLKTKFTNDATFDQLISEMNSKFNIAYSTIQKSNPEQFKQAQTEHFNYQKKLYNLKIELQANKNPKSWKSLISSNGFTLEELGAIQWAETYKGFDNYYYHHQELVNHPRFRMSDSSGPVTLSESMRNMANFYTDPNSTFYRYLSRAIIVAYSHALKTLAVHGNISNENLGKFLANRYNGADFTKVKSGNPLEVYRDATTQAFQVEIVQQIVNGLQSWRKNKKSSSIVKRFLTIADDFNEMENAYASGKDIRNNDSSTIYANEHQIVHEDGFTQKAGLPDDLILILSELHPGNELYLLLGHKPGESIQAISRTVLHPITEEEFKLTTIYRDLSYSNKISGEFFKINKGGYSGYIYTKHMYDDGRITKILFDSKDPFIGKSIPSTKNIIVGRLENGDYAIYRHGTTKEGKKTIRHTPLEAMTLNQILALKNNGEISELQNVSNQILNSSSINNPFFTNEAFRNAEINKIKDIASDSSRFFINIFRGIRTDYTPKETRILRKQIKSILNEFEAQGIHPEKITLITGGCIRCPYENLFRDELRNRIAKANRIKLKDVNLSEIIFHSVSAPEDELISSATAAVPVRGMHSFASYLKTKFALSLLQEQVLHIFAGGAQVARSQLEQFGVEFGDMVDGLTLESISNVRDNILAYVGGRVGPVDLFGKALAKANRSNQVIKWKNLSEEVLSHIRSLIANRLNSAKEKLSNKDIAVFFDTINLTEKVIASQKKAKHPDYSNFEIEDEQMIEAIVEFETTAEAQQGCGL